MALRASTPEGQRLLDACELHDIGLEMMRQRFRREHPSATDESIETMVRSWVSDRPLDGPGRAVIRPRG